MQNLPFLEFLQTLGMGIPCTKLIKAINPQTKTIPPPFFAPFTHLVLSYYKLAI